VKVAIYARVSKTAGDPTSIEKQERAARAWAKQHGHRVVDVYRDNGVSGAQFDRPELGRLLIDAGARLFDGVIVYDLDRLARDLIVQETIIGELARAGAELHSINQPNLEGDDPHRVFARQVFGASAQLHKAVTVVRLRAGREAAKKRAGYCEGQARFGFRRDAGTMVPDKNEQSAIALIKRLRGSRAPASYREIADELERRGYKPRRGEKWHPMSVRRIALRPNKPH